MKKSSANLAVVAARASRAGRTASVNMPAHLGTVSTFYGTGVVRKTRAVPMTGAQRDSRGRPSDWSRSASISGTVGSVIRDGRWSRTVSEG